MGDLAATNHFIQAMLEIGVVVGVGQRIPLIGITVNPFFPEYRIKFKNYESAFVDPVKLECIIKQHVSVPVYDVVRSGVQGLVDTILLHQT